MRFFRRLSDNFRRRVELAELTDSADQQNFIIFLKIKSNFMRYFSRLLKETQENPPILLQFFESTAKSLTLEHYNFDFTDSEFIRSVNYEALRACQIYVQGLGEVGLSCSYQCFLLYGEFMEKPYKPQTFINFAEVITSMERIIQGRTYLEDSLELREVRKIISSIFYFLCTLTTINEEDLFTT
jgi:hypothetical protein